MKDTIRISLLGLGLAAIMATASILPAGKTTAPTSEEISWIEFCKARGYDPVSDDEDILNEFLDTWVGSVEEEQAFNNLPAQE